MSDEKEQYENYEEYLDTKLWESIKRKKLAGNKKCAFCGNQSTHVCHLSYSKETLEGDNDSSLIALCAGCSKVLEYDEDGYKNSPPEKFKIIHFYRNFNQTLEKEKRVKEKVKKKEKYYKKRK